ncbi:hypothetical protein CVT25_001519 [Psilocybe cyanescens]|uniref:Uncharacterized protein n=1 Tax=Psilocybe cyanescens TaxID=93625 RepID=A0A409X5D3_PSICY|nr:hypothetical protein CVT25_001519 [Psilocybe cyanescens]
MDIISPSSQAPAILAGGNGALSPPFTQAPTVSPSTCNFGWQNSALSSPFTQAAVVSALNNEEDKVLWSNIVDFDFDDKTFITAFFSACGSKAQSFSSTNTGPSILGFSTNFYIGTSQSVAAHSATPLCKKKYYAVTKGQWTSVCDKCSIQKHGQASG